MTNVILYSRPGCHLCDDARAILRQEQVACDEIDIESDDSLLKRYLERIPVISIEGEDVFEFFVDPAQLRERIAPADRSVEPNQR